MSNYNNTRLIYEYQTNPFCSLISLCLNSITSWSCCCSIWACSCAISACSCAISAWRRSISILRCSTRAILCLSYLVLVAFVFVVISFLQHGHVLFVWHHLFTQALWNRCLHGSVLTLLLSFISHKHILQSPKSATSTLVNALTSLLQCFLQHGVPSGLCVVALYQQVLVGSLTSRALHMIAILYWVWKILSINYSIFCINTGVIRKYTVTQAIYLSLTNVVHHALSYNGLTVCHYERQPIGGLWDILISVCSYQHRNISKLEDIFRYL